MRCDKSEIKMIKKKVLNLFEKHYAPQAKNAVIL